MTFLILTLWILITVICAIFAYLLGRRSPKGHELSPEEKRLYEKERRELENFWTYNGESQT